MRRYLKRPRGGGLGTVLVLAAAGLLTACDSIHESPDYERHRYSQLSEPSDRDDVLYFDVKVDVNFPEDNPVAEDKRMAWLEAWLAQRNMCADGFEIANRREFDSMEYNPGRYNLRYEVTCKVLPD